MDFSKLRAFIVVAEELNFRKSAEILGMSQPPLTRLISGLEKELGTQLFERTTRTVKLTGAGVLLLREARDIAAALERIETDVRAAGKMKSGNLRIGFSRTAFMVRFPALIEAFRSRYPRVQLELEEKSSRDILKHLKDGRLDLGFVESIEAYPGLECTEVASENLGVLVPKKHPLCSRSEIHFSDLKNETLILHHPREAQEFHDRISALARGMDRKPRVYIKNEGESCPILVATGKGVSLTIAGSQFIAPDATQFIPIRDLFMPIQLFWRKDEQAARVKTFVSFVSEKASVLSKKGECLVIQKNPEL